MKTSFKGVHCALGAGGAPSAAIQERATRGVNAQTRGHARRIRVVDIARRASYKGGHRFHHPPRRTRHAEADMLKDFRAFIVRGNVVDLAVAVVIGGAFGAIVTSFVNDILMPPIGLVLGRVNFADLFLTLSSGSYPSLAAAKAAGAATLNYGAFLNTIVNFVIIAFAVFLLVRQADRLKAAPTPATPSTKECPQCAMAIPLRASRCPHCTSSLAPAR
jgi:large conductance mechanosensitive channel